MVVGAPLDSTAAATDKASAAPPLSSATSTSSASFGAGNPPIQDTTLGGGDMEQDYSISWTIEHLKLYNPDFQLTPEVIAILERFFHQLDPDDRGVISGSVLIEKIRQVDPTELHFTTEQLHLLNDEKLMRRAAARPGGTIDPDDVTFDEFCTLVMRWKEISPVGVQMVYTTWVKEMGAVEFGLLNETDGMFMLDLPPTSPAVAGGAVSSSTAAVSTPSSSGAAAAPTVPLFNFATSSIEIRSFLAGGLAGVIAKSLLSPVDRVKLLFQVSEHLHFSLRNAVHMGLDIVKRDGAVALFRGNTINLVRVFMSAGIQHSSFDFVRRRFHDYNRDHHERHRDSTPYVKNLSTAQLILSGSIAGCCSTMCTYPIDVVRTRYMVQQGKIKYASVFDAVACMYKAEGLRSFSRGLLVQLVGIVPYTGIGFSLNEHFKQAFHEFQHQYFVSSDANAVAATDAHQLSPLSKFMCSYLAGSIAQTVTYPLDTIRRRIQTDGYVTGAASVGPKYTNMRTTCQLIFKQEGLRGFYKGATVTWLRGPLATGISLTAYDLLKELLGVEKV
ncbi:Aste57867_18945 [Aphanomyces stellatus]|uniref:Aste57867_18945 protein n=1 Tax=Aphanomyces stellatus TaxID=120398 RepID=A0A485LDC3_9STRA|nr:hypothetical protein As57867_018881 [Aphanomyces stellatus]VFT95675.1 Aste57867_18945 [Aphanomyces stellatus]